MKTYYFNNLPVARPKSLVAGKKTFLPPTDQQLTEAGYEIQEQAEPEPTPPTYEQRVVARIRLRYSVDDELALLRQRDTKPDEFNEYNTFCEQIKAEEKEK